MKIQKLYLFLVIVSALSCKTGDSTPDWTGNYLGVYSTQAGFGDKFSRYTWIISKEGHNQLRIGLLTEDTYKLGSADFSFKYYYSVAARMKDQHTFDIDEEVKANNRVFRVQATGTRMENGWLAVTLPSIANEGESEYLEFKKDTRVSAPQEANLAGTYTTTTIEGNQTVIHTMVVSRGEGNLLRINYRIEDLVTVGGNTLRGISEYPLEKAVMGQSNSLKIDETAGEEGKKVHIRASGLLINMKYEDTYQPDVIALGIEYTRPDGAEARKSDYLEFKKQ